MSAITWLDRKAPSAAAIEEIARAAYAGLPEELREKTGDILFSVEEFPTDDVLDSLGIESEYDLLGLYHGVSVDRRSSHDLPRATPDTIHLYRRALLDYWAEHDETLGNLVTHVMIHEIGHHFGLSDATMAAIEADATLSSETHG
jgi:predicted Zn-dependent protease with MMP-like domain